MKLKAIMMAGLFCSAPAYAASVTVDFLSDEAGTITVTFDTETQTATSGDSSAPFTMSDDGKTTCSTVVGGEEVCVTFAEPVPAEPTVGHSMGFSNTLGHEGTATVTAIE